MSIRLPGLEIREPLVRKPFYGALIGGLTGSFFALLAGDGAFHVSRDLQTFGFISGGASGGFIVGLLAPWFRRRLTVAAAVWVAAASGLLIANVQWREYPDPVGSIPFGLLGAALYAVALWNYRG